MAMDNGLKTRVLVIDDEQGIREGCRRVLASEGLEADVAENGREGLELLRGQPYGLVFVDLKMPEMGGLELLAAAQDLATDAVFIVITGYATLEMAVDATKRGAYDFVAKPFAPDELIGVTRKALEHRRLVRQRNQLQEERERRLLELATEKGRLRSIVESMTDGVIVTNREGQVVLHNAAALWAMQPEAASGEPRPLTVCLSCAELRELLSRAQPGSEVKRLMREIPAGATEQDVMMASVSPVLDETGQCLGAVTVLRDVSELKKVEQVKAQFVNMVAHELRAPLAAIDSHLNVMLSGIVNDPEKQRHMMVRSHSRLTALLELVNDLLAVSRMETGTIRREIRPLDVADLVTEVCELMAGLAQQKEVALSSDIDDNMPALEADREEIVALLTNLLSNAIKYNRVGGQVTVTARAESPYLRLEVADTGAGISDEGQRRVFDEFFREKTDATRLVTGTGLGLTIVKRIADFYHGRLALQSELGCGSTFAVWLPLSQSSVA